MLGVMTNTEVLGIEITDKEQALLLTALAAYDKGLMARLPRLPMLDQLAAHRAAMYEKNLCTLSGELTLTGMVVARMLAAKANREASGGAEPTYQVDEEAHLTGQRSALGIIVGCHCEWCKATLAAIERDAMVPDGYIVREMI